MLPSSVKLHILPVIEGCAFGISNILETSGTFGDITHMKKGDKLYYTTSLPPPPKTKLEWSDKHGLVIVVLSFQSPEISVQQF